MIDFSQDTTATPEVKKRPTPPRKPSKERPLPPSKPSKSSIVDSEQIEPPPPSKKPRPPTKPRSSTTVLPPVTPIVEQPQPKPRPRRRTQAQADSTPERQPNQEIAVSKETTPPAEDTVVPEETVSASEEDIAIVPPSGEIVPILFVETPITPEELTVEDTENEAHNAFSPILEEEEVTSPGPSILNEAASPIESSMEPLPVEDSSESKDDPTDTPSHITEATNEKVENAIEQSPSEKKEVVNEVTKNISQEETQEEPVAEENGVEKDDKESSDGSLYEDMDMGGPPPEKDGEVSSDGTDYEMVDFNEPVIEIKPSIPRHHYNDVPTEVFSDQIVDINAKESLVPQSLETASKGQSTSSYVMMDPQPPLDEYIEVQESGFKEKADSYDYDNPTEWGSTINDSPRSTKIGDYDVPRPASSLSDGGAGIMSSGSTGSRTHGSPGIPRIGSKGQSDRLNALRMEGVDQNIERERSLSGGSQGVS